MGDPRYSVDLEYTGAFEDVPGLPRGLRWVARFCGLWIDSATTEDAAQELADRYEANRWGVMAEETFNWHELDHEGFLSWMVASVIADVRADKLGQLSDATDRFTQCKITMQLNGIEADAMGFIRGVERHMKLSLESAAREYVKKHLSEKISEFDDVLNNARRSILAHFPVEEDY